MKPYSEASERNREPILQVLQQWFVAPGDVLEIGSGTGQHAVYFAARLPHLTWIASDRLENHASIALWIEDARLPNLRGPLPLDVAEKPWPVAAAQYAYSANTAHIMSWHEVILMVQGVAQVLQPGGVFCLYGPFNREGQYTSASNRAFDESLRARDPRRGLRDDRALFDLARRCGLTFRADHAMPANNRTLVWARD
jgi:SAM-dependent methyltransferase